MQEGRTEAGNADAPYWFVVFKQKGLGLNTLSSMDNQPVYRLKDPRIDSRTWNHRRRRRMSYDLYVVRPDIPEDCGQYGCPRAKKFILDYWMGRCDKENTSWTSC